MDYGDTITALIALIAVVISLVTLRRTRYFNQRQIELQEETARLDKLQREIIERELEEKSRREREIIEKNEEEKKRKEAEEAIGAVSARIVLHRGTPGIEVANLGKVELRNLSLSVEMIEPVDDRAFLESEINEKFPVTSIQPGDKIFVRTGPHGSFDLLEKFKLNFHWETIDGESHRWEEEW
jgi:hypothetical protein